MFRDIPAGDRGRFLQPDKKVIGKGTIMRKPTMLHGYFIL
jgi:hypothetical protein